MNPEPRIDAKLPAEDDGEIPRKVLRLDRQRQWPAKVIADFRYSAEEPVAPNTVVLEMFAGPGGPMGILRIPADVREAMLAAELAPVEDALNLGLALGYAVTVAAIGNADLLLSGDLKVWNPEWGKLLAPGESTVVNAPN